MSANSLPAWCRLCMTVDTRFAHIYAHKLGFYAHSHSQISSSPPAFPRKRTLYFALHTSWPLFRYRTWCSRSSHQISLMISLLKLPLTHSKLCQMVREAHNHRPLGRMCMHSNTLAASQYLVLPEPTFACLAFHRLRVAYCVCWLCSFQRV